MIPLSRCLELPPGDSDPQWGAPVRVATGSMPVTVGLMAAVGVFALGLPVGPGVLLEAGLAPTDPVSAGGVQVREAQGSDRVRSGRGAGRG